MKPNRSLLHVALNVLLAVAALSWAGRALAQPAEGQPAASLTFTTPGAHFFPSAQPAPLAGAGARAAHLANRVFLDDSYTTVVVDPTSHRVHIVNTHRYREERIIADLLFMGRATTENGKRVPVSVHLKVKKTGSEVTHGLHAHVTVRSDLKDGAVDPYTVVVSDGERQITVMTPAQAKAAVEDPSTADEVSRALLKFKDHLEGVPGGPAAVGDKLADISLGLGRGPLRKYILRAEIVSLDGANAALVAQKDLAAMLSKGAWQLRLTALSSLLPDDAFKRDLKLLGIADLPILAPIKANGLQKHQTLTFELRGGTGSVRFNGQSAPLPGAVDVARQWLEFNFLGLILTEQARTRVGG